MKKHLLFIALTLCALAAEAQKEQLCKVREQNSKRKPIANAQVIFEDAPAAVSQSDGTVRLLFQTLKAGEWTFKLDINRAGYELVNEKEVEKVKLSADGQFGVDIILARAGVVDSLRAIYFGVSNTSLKKGFAAEKAKLLRQMNDMRLTAEQKAHALDSLQELLDIQLKNLNELAERFARTNFDDVDTLYSQALELFKAGKIDETISLLEQLDPVAVIQKYIADDSLDTDSEKKIAARRAERAKVKPRLIASARLLADMYNLRFNPDKAEVIYENLIRLDSNDLEILQEAADFYKNNHRYDKALRTYPLVIAHPKAEDWQVANAYSSMGEMHTATGNLPAALDAYTKFFESYEKLYQSDPQRSFFKDNLAISYEKLGSTHMALGNLPRALTFFEKGIELSKELYESYPQNVEFKNGLAISYVKLVQINIELEDLLKAIEYLRAAEKLFLELHRDSPENAQFKQYLDMVQSALQALQSSKD